MTSSNLPHLCYIRPIEFKNANKWHFTESNIFIFPQGVTAREMAHYFFDKDAYMDWGSKFDFALYF